MVWQIVSISCWFYIVYFKYEYMPCQLALRLTYNRESWRKALQPVFCQISTHNQPDWSSFIWSADTLISHQIYSGLVEIQRKDKSTLSIQQGKVSGKKPIMRFSRILFVLMSNPKTLLVSTVGLKFTISDNLLCQKWLAAVSNIPVANTKCDYGLKKMYIFHRMWI